MHLRLLLTFLAVAAIMLVSPIYASDTLLAEVKTIRLPTAGGTVTAKLIGAERFNVAWREKGGQLPQGLFAAADSTFYYTSAGKRIGLLPSGEAAKADLSAQKAQLPAPAYILAGSNSISSKLSGNEWTYQLASGKSLLAGSLLTDSSGYLYFQDRSGGWYSLFGSGKLRYQLQLDLDMNKYPLTCMAAPSGDSVCMSSQIGIIGIREKTTAPRVLIDGREQFYAYKPFILRGVTLMPLRGVFEKLGAEVKWNPSDRSITASNDGIKIKMFIHSKQATVGNHAISLSEAPLIANGTTFIPLRFVSESLGAMVIWEKSTGTIQIVSPS